MAGKGKATKELTICNSLGLHARAAAKLVETADRFTSEIFMEKNGHTADAKSVLSLLTLECPMGSKVTVSAEGNDCQLAIDALAELIESKFGEQ